MTAALLQLARSSKYKPFEITKTMKITTALLTPLILASFTFTSFAADADKKAGPVNEKCPMTGKAINPKCTYAFEDVTYAFCSGKCRGEFKENVTTSLYTQIGGKAAIDAAVDLFYTKVLADKRVNFFFEDVSMKRQHNKQKQFLSAALGSPVPYTGMDMRKGHKHLDLTEAQCNRRESGSHTGGIES